MKRTIVCSALFALVASAAVAQQLPPGTHSVDDHSQQNAANEISDAESALEKQDYKTAEAKLKVLSGTTFDDSYIKGQVKAHQQTVALLKKEIASGQDADAKSFAQSILPTVRSHLKAANTLAAAQTASK